MASGDALCSNLNSLLFGISSPRCRECRRDRRCGQRTGCRPGPRPARRHRRLLRRQPARLHGRQYRPRLNRQDRRLAKLSRRPRHRPRTPRRRRHGSPYPSCLGSTESSPTLRPGRSASTTACAPATFKPISTSSSFASIAAGPATPLSNPCSALPAMPGPSPTRC